MRTSALVLAACLAGLAQAQDKVAIPTAGLSNSPEPLVGHLFQPRGAGPHPAVVMLHGCGGAYARDGSVNPRHRMWGEYLAAEGYAAILVDSFTPRGFKELCTQKIDARTVRPRDRAGDAYAALAYMRSRKDVDPERVAMLGWSHGGSTVLQAMAGPAPTPAGFKAAIALYPGCTGYAKRPDRFHPYAPLIVLIGEADDWTPASSCRELTDIVKKRPEPMEIVLYAGAYHDFDNPALKKERLRADVPNGVNPGKGVTVAPDPVAREDAKKRVIEFLKRVIPGAAIAAMARDPI